MDGFTTLRVGGTLSLTGDPARSPLGRSVRDGIIFFEQWFSSQPDILIDGEPYRLAIEIFDDESSAERVAELYTAMLASGNYSYFLGPVRSDFAIICMDILDGNTLLVQTSSSTNHLEGTESSYSIIPPPSKTFSGGLSQARLMGARSWSYIVEDQVYQKDACLGTVSEASALGYSAPACNLTVPNSLVGVTSSSSEAYLQAIEHLAEHCRQDVVLLCSYSEPVMLMLERARQLNFSPNLFLISPITASYDTATNSSDGELLTFVAGYTSWSPTLNYPDDGLYGTPQDFSEDFYALLGYYPDGVAAAGAAAPLYLWNALGSSESPAWSDVSYAMSRTNMQTFWGRVSYSATNLMLGVPPILQWYPAPILGTVVAPPLGQAHAMVYPAPTWTQRRQTTGWMVYAGDVAMTVLAAMATVASLVAMGYVVARRHTQVMRAAQFEFIAIALGGTLLMYSSIYTWLYYVTDAGCLALPWLLATGFVLVFACLASKTWRVHRLFNNSQLRAITVSRWPMLAFLLVSCAVVWSLLLVWSVVDPLTANLTVPDPFCPALNYYSCQTGTVGTALLIVILSIEGGLLVATALIAFRVRNVQLLLFNEAKFIGFAIYNLIILGVLLLCFAVSDVGHTTFFWIRTICILIAAFITAACITVPKFISLNHKQVVPSLSNVTSLGSVIRTTSADDIDDAYNNFRQLSLQVAQLEEEHARLRVSLDQIKKARGAEHN